MPFQIGVMVFFKDCVTKLSGKSMGRQPAGSYVKQSGKYEQTIQVPSESTAGNSLLPVGNKNAQASVKPQKNCMSFSTQ
jgi:hypothetical protein